VFLVVLFVVTENAFEAIAKQAWETHHLDKVILSFESVARLPSYKHR